MHTLASSNHTLLEYIRLGIGRLPLVTMNLYLYSDVRQLLPTMWLPADRVRHSFTGHRTLTCEN